MLDGLDVEAKGWTDDTGILPIDLQHDCCLTQVIQAHHENSHLLLLALDLSDDAEETHLGGVAQEINQETRKM
uniref:ADP-ribosylation factor n=1 Tax=Arundo donax TaxID=35708 RepID=A0A0A9DBF8_ARUDO